MYFHKVGIQQKTFEKCFFVGVSKVTDEKSMSRIRNTASTGSAYGAQI